MNKKGQFFIFVAVILALVIYVVVSQVNRIEEKILLEDFNELSKNYATEAPKKVNDIVKDVADKTPEEQTEAIEGGLNSFTSDFLDYAKTQDPNMGFVYVYYDKNTGDYLVSNYLSSGTIETIDGGQIPSGQESTISNIKLDVAGQTFKQNVPIKLTTFGNLNSGVSQSPDIKIGGITYKPNLEGKSIAIIAQSFEEDTVRVSAEVI
ncbi:MAG: hypothetical protein AB1571_01875 [Nanoarchaeota archaeon]